MFIFLKVDKLSVTSLKLWSRKKDAACFAFSYYFLCFSPCLEQQSKTTLNVIVRSMMMEAVSSEYFFLSLLCFCVCLECSRVGAHGAIACWDVYGCVRAEQKDKGRAHGSCGWPLSGRFQLLWAHLKWFEFPNLFIVTAWFDSEFTFHVKYSELMERLQLDYIMIFL